MPAARSWKRLAALAAAVFTALGTVLALAVATPGVAQAATAPPYWAQSPFNVPSGTGVNLPFTEYEAESASTTGKLIGPDFTQGDLATEASGREAVQLTASGQYVQFTLTSAANAFDVHYALPQGASGTLSVYVNGTKLSKELSLTSAYSYISTPGIMGSQTHKLYDDARMMFGQTYPAGTTVRLEADSSDTALPYTVDVADFYNVPAAATQPANSVSVTSEGADPTGRRRLDPGVPQRDLRGQLRRGVRVDPVRHLPRQLRAAGQLRDHRRAGDWYSQIKTNEFIDNTSAVSGPVNLSGFAILGSTVGRHDDSTANAIDGSLGSGFTVNGLWIQDTNVGFWLQYGNSNCTVENTVVESTDADGLNFNGNATNCTVKNNFLRNTGDDGLAIWSYPSADSGITFANNTIVQPTLANGIADYGGSNNTISNNVIADTEPLGSGIAISNEQFLSPFTPLSGTITVSGNYLIRAGAENPNWGHPMGAVRFDAYDSAFSNVTVNYSGGAILDSPYEAFEFVAGAGTGNAVNGVNISNVNVQNLGTVVMQAETTGTASVGGVTASGVGVSGAYNNAYPSNTAGGYTFNLGSGNSGWSTTPVLTAFPNPAQPGSLTASPSSLSFGDVASGSTSAAQTVTVSNPGSSAASVSSVSVSGPFSQTNTCGSSIAAGGSCAVSVKFSPTSGGSQTGALSVATSAPGSPLTVALSGTGVTSTTNLAQGQPATASSSYQTYVASNVTDGNASTYWESTDGAGYPQTITVDLGSVQSIGSLTLDLPPSSAWATRTETLSVLGSSNGSTFSQLVGSAGYTFNPSTGNTVTISLPSGTSARYVQLSFTGNTGWSAAQLSEFEVFPGGGSSSPGNLTASPSSLSFGSTTVGATQHQHRHRVELWLGRGLDGLGRRHRPVQRDQQLRYLARGGRLLHGQRHVRADRRRVRQRDTVGEQQRAWQPADRRAVRHRNGGGQHQPRPQPARHLQWLHANLRTGQRRGRGHQQLLGEHGQRVPAVVPGRPRRRAQRRPDRHGPAALELWGTRTQTITIQGSTDGSNYTTLAGSANYTFNPSTGNTVTVTFTAASVRYLKLTFTANTAWPAGQLSELQAYAS